MSSNSHFKLWAMRAVALCLAWAATAALAAKVVETAPADIARSLRDDTVTVLLLWSPDPKCGYCVGEDKAFDALAKPYGDNVVFRRVQWSPWTAFPQLGLDVRIRGVPHIFVFRGRQAAAVLARQIKGDAPWVKSHIDTVVAGRLWPLFGNEVLSTASGAPKVLPTPADVETTKLMLTSHVLEQGTERCIDLNVRLMQPLTTQLAQWRTRHHAPPLAQAPQFVERVGVSAAAQMLVDTDKAVASQLATNDISLAGCTELVEWLKKD